MTTSDEFERALDELAADQEPGLVEQLRTELAERSPCDAGACPSWPRFARWLRDNGRDDLGEWLALTLAGPRRLGDHERLLSVATRTVTILGGRAKALWTGELGWSLWFGPFMLAYIGEPPADPQSGGSEAPGEGPLDPIQLQATLGPLATFLARDRVWIDDAPLRRLLAELEPGVPLFVDRTLPGAQEVIVAYLLRELREHLDDEVLSIQPVSWRSRGWRLGADLDFGRAYGVLSCATGRDLANVDHRAARALREAVVVGPPELLSRWPAAGRRAPVFGPLPAFERRYERLAAPAPALIGRLRAELDERPSSRAHECPTWTVYGDWLFDHGYELLGEWLRLDLKLASSGGGRQTERNRLRKLAERTTRALATRPSQPDRLRQLWNKRHTRYCARWLGPFMLEYVDPGVVGGLGRDELQATLGELATFLSPTRVYTAVDRVWVEQAMARREVPTLAPTPSPTELFADLLLDLHEQSDEALEGPAYQVRVARPGRAVDHYGDGVRVTNVGPIAADNQATAVVCCETEADLERHARDWPQLQDYQRVILLGSPELLARWRHPGVRIEPYRSGFGV